MSKPESTSITMAAYRLGCRHRSEGVKKMPATVPADAAWAYRAGWYGKPLKETH